MKYLLLSAAPALLAFAYWYAIYPPYFCSGMCCVVKSKCASVPMKENIVQPKYEKVASALAESLKVGENAVGLILTRSMAEMSRFAVAKGANPITFLGLAGMGDLVATCTSNLSRNFQLGMHLGNGLKLDEAKLKVGQVAEGIRTLEVIKTESANLNISMPLVDSLYNIVFNNASSKTFIDDLVNNPHEVDVEFTY